jgi:hypothetical protein
LSGDGSKGASPSSSIINETIESVGNGWYRISITGDLDTSQVRIQIANGDGGYSAVVGDNIYIQDAQLEQGLAATEYIESGASTGKAGILEDSPRFDYSGGASCPSLLLEPSRTNLITSEYFDDWTKIGVSVETNTSETLSPEGLYNATKITSTTADPNIYKQVSVTATETTFSFYIKGEGSSIGKTSRVLFWYTGTATGSTTSHNFILTGEWQRISFSTTPTGSGTMSFRIDTPADSADVGETAYIWGAQVEEGSYPTSYIPNHSGGSVTRAEDSAINADISSYYVQNGSTLFFDIECDGEVDESNVTAILRLGTSINTTRVSFLQGYNRIYTTWYDGNTGALGTINNLDAGSRVKIAVQIANNGIARMNGGVNGISNTIRDYTLSSENYTRLEIYRSSRFKQLMVFPTLLSNTDCEILTGTSYESFAAMATALNYTTYE